MLMKKRNQRKNMAVAPVLATLLMIAVAVAMSVIIFMWSQGFLAGTSESTGAQQGSQNQAAQSSIIVETVTGIPGTYKPNFTLLARNVGAVAITVGSITVTGLSSNAGFTGSLLATVFSNTILNVTANDGTTWTGTANGLQVIAKGSGIIIQLKGPAAAGTTQIESGDVVTIKITTDKGTFAQQSYTVP